MKKLFSVILAAVLLTACASAPSEVQKENDVLDRASVAEPDKMKQTDKSNT